MKNSLITLVLALVSSLVLAQTTTENYIKSTSFKVETTDGEHKAGTSTDLTSDDKIETITYLDGLGRPKQSIVKQAGGNKENIITPIVYDGLGRKVIDYLPTITLHTTSALNFVDNTNLILNQGNQYLQKYPEENWLNLGDVNAFSEKHFENSPLNRVLEQGAPGKDWQIDETSDTDHTIKFNYQANASVEVDYLSVIFPTLNTEEPQLVFEGQYNANELYKTIIKDENWQPNQIFPKAHTTEEFKNSLGQVLLKRTFDSGGIKHDTNYVYDDFGNLTYVLSPKGSTQIYYYPSLSSSSHHIDDIPFIPTTPKGIPITGGSGYAKVRVDVPTSTLTVDFHLNFNTLIELKKGPIELIGIGLPNMIIGTIANGNYTVSIQDGYLFIAGNGSLNSVVESISTNIPAASINYEILNSLCYEYHYDKRNRLIEKKIPQKGWEYIVYDKLDRPVLNQDANLRITNDWLFTKYDEFDRVVYTGKFYKLSSSNASENQRRKNVQDILDAENDFNESSITNNPTNIDVLDVYHTNKVYPTSNLTLYTVNYYDAYNPILNTAFTNPGTVYGKTISSDTKSLPTGSLVRALGTTDWITSVTYYDDKAQPIYIGSDNEYLNTRDVIKTDLDFIGKLIESESSHTKDSNSPIVVTDRFTYDHTNRLLTQKQQITGHPEELIVKNEYDELGQLKVKNVGNSETTPLQSVDYDYNIRGWLKQINEPSVLGNDLFAFKINYNTVELGGNSASNKLYNGNISETIWQTVNDATEAIYYRGYYYEYDALNRINWARYRMSDTSRDGHYNLKNVQYDKNGNIVSLGRTGYNNSGGFSGGMDNLVYSYIGNQLDDVTENGNNTIGFTDTAGSQNVDYTYDLNGNMVKDLNKGIGTSSVNGIIYNHLNLPIEVKFNNSNTKKIDYIYDATGLKLKKVVNDNGNISNTEYAGNYIYENSTLKFFSHTEGYVEPNSSNYDYVYQYKDHLGNIRLSYSDADGDGIIQTNEPNPMDNEIIEENNYYPFGLKHKGYNNVINGTDHPYGFGGKEEQDELGLGWIDITARNYDPALGRWMNLDPLAEIMRRHSPYNYGFDNPIFFVDPDGMMPGPGDTNTDTDPVDTQSIAVTRKAAGIWNAIKTVWNNTPAENTALLLTTPAKTLRSIGDTGISVVNNGFVATAKESISSNIQQIAAEEGISPTDATQVWATGVSIDIGLGIATDGLATPFLKGAGTIAKIADDGTDLFRAVSDAELNDLSNGFRVPENSLSSYDTGKLFATTADDAAKFGKNNFKWDGKPNTIVKTNVPASTMRASTKFTADGMPAVSIPGNKLGDLNNIISFKSSPFSL